MNIQPFQTRRTKLIAEMRALGGGVAIVPTAPEVTRNADVTYPYRYDSRFHYLSGFAEPEAVLLLLAGQDGDTRSVLFCRARHPEREIWDGFRYGPERAATEFGFDETYPIEQLDSEVARFLADQPAVFMHAEGAWQERLEKWLAAVRAQVRSGVQAPAVIRDIDPLIDEMRLFKDAGEHATMRAAAEISARAHTRAMQGTRPGLFEYQVEAELLREFRHGGSQYPAYPSIVAGGANACVLHYGENSALLNDGDLLLIDAGCELDGYASDVTRTFPVNGRFSGPQRDLYQLVLAAQASAIAAVRPGNDWDNPHQAAVRVLAQGMIDVGLLSGSLDSVLETAAYRQFYMHSTGHWIGRDVHDVGNYREPKAAAATPAKPPAWRTLMPGMALTVEPGIYVRPADKVPEHFWNIGIRIEDDVIVTADGCDILSANAPKQIDEIEAVMRA